LVLFTKIFNCVRINPAVFEDPKSTEITQVNAKSWLDHLQQIAAVDPIRCAIVMLTDPKVLPLPPTKIPVAKAKPAFGSKR
jgi:hypothetical protein